MYYNLPTWFLIVTTVILCGFHGIVRQGATVKEGGGGGEWGSSSDQSLSRPRLGRQPSATRIWSSLGSPNPPTRRARSGLSATSGAREARWGGGCQGAVPLPLCADRQYSLTLDDDVYVQVLNSSAFFALWLLWLHLHRVAKCCLTRCTAAVEARSRRRHTVHGVRHHQGQRPPSHPGPDH